MKAVVLREVGGDLALEDVPGPEGESVVDVRAAGINFADVLVRRGLYPQMPALPHVLGNEVAGLQLADQGLVDWGSGEVEVVDILCQR